MHSPASLAQLPSTFGLARAVSRAARRTPEGEQGAHWLLSLLPHWPGPGSEAAREPPLTLTTSHPTLGRTTARNRGVTGWRRRDLQGFAGQAPLSIWIRPFRIHGSTQNAGRKAGR